MGCAGTEDDLDGRGGEGQPHRNQRLLRMSWSQRKGAADTEHRDPSVSRESGRGWGGGEAAAAKAVASKGVWVEGYKNTNAGEIYA